MKQKKDLVVLTVAVDLEGSIPVQKFVAKYGYSFYVLIDSKSKVIDRYRVERIPTTFLIDKQGRIVGKAVGQGIGKVLKRYPFLIG